MRRTLPAQPSPGVILPLTTAFLVVAVSQLSCFQSRGLAPGSVSGRFACVEHLAGLIQVSDGGGSGLGVPFPGSAAAVREIHPGQETALIIFEAIIIVNTGRYRHADLCAKAIFAIFIAALGHIRRQAGDPVVQIVFHADGRFFIQASFQQASEMVVGHGERLALAGVKVLAGDLLWPSARIIRADIFTEDVVAVPCPGMGASPQPLMVLIVVGRAIAGKVKPTAWAQAIVSIENLTFLTVRETFTDRAAKFIPPIPGQAAQRVEHAGENFTGVVLKTNSAEPEVPRLRLARRVRPAAAGGGAMAGLGNRVVFRGNSRPRQ